MGLTDRCRRVIGFAWLLAQEQSSTSLAELMSEVHKIISSLTPIHQSAVFVKGNTSS